MGKVWYSSHWSPHNPEAVGSSPTPAITKASFSIERGFFVLNLPLSACKSFTFIKK